MLRSVCADDGAGHVVADLIANLPFVVVGNHLGDGVPNVRRQLRRRIQDGQIPD